MQALFAKAFGKKTDVPSKSTADISINSVNYTQQIEVYTNQKKEINQADSTILLTLFEKVLIESFFKEIKPKLEKNKKITFAQLALLGLKTSYNPANLNLEIEVKPELQKPRILTLYQENTPTLKESNRLQPSKFGGYLNLYSNVTTTTSQDPSLNLRLEGSINIKDYVIESTANRSNNKWVFGDTTITHDRPDKLYRYQLGHITTPIKGFQDNLSLLGINLSKNFNLDSALQIMPRAKITFTITTESEVEVYINGKMQTQFQLDKGQYTLEDIGLIDGANDIDIRIKDVFGKVMHKKIRQYYDSTLLKPGLSTFTSSLGIPKEQQKITSLKQIIFSGYYQQGLYKNLTLGIDLQLKHDRTLIGSEVITSNKAGRLKLNMGLSYRKKGKTGLSASFTYHPNINKSLANKKTSKIIRSIQVRGEYRSKYFDQLTTESASKNSFIHAKLQASLAFKLGKKWNGNLSSGFTYKYNDQLDNFASIRLSTRFRQRINWNISAVYSKNDQLSIQSQIIIPLSKKLFSRKQDIVLNYNNKSNNIVGTYNLRRLGALDSKSLGGRFKVSHSDNSQQISSELNYKTRYFETRLNAQQTPTSQQLDIAINSSLLCAGSTCGLSYPVTDSFALIKGPSSQEKSIAIKNGYGKFRYSDGSDLPDNYDALIKNKGSHATVLLDSYKYQRISIDEGGLPFGYDPEKTEFEFIPPYHSSFTIIAGGKPGTIVSGVLVDKDKKAMEFKGGQWLPEKEDGKILAFFTNKTGRFYLPSVPTGRYKLELFDYPKMKELTIDVPEKKEKTHNLGKLIVITN